ncbi:hypothetical protein ACQP3F_32520, partial [Escherichia coli]
IAKPLSLVTFEPFGNWTLMFKISIRLHHIQKAVNVQTVYLQVLPNPKKKTSQGTLSTPEDPKESKGAQVRLTQWPLVTIEILSG